MGEAAEMSIRDLARMLAVSAPTARQLVEHGVVDARKKPRGSRFSWIVDRASTDRFVANGGYQRRERGTLARVRADLESLRTDVETKLNGSASGDSDLRATVVALKETVLAQQLAADLMRQADDARADVVRHLLSAAQASELADQKRRDALAALTNAVSALTSPGHVGQV